MFYDTVTEFFQALLDSNIEPIVIMDGIDYDKKKIETTRSRREGSINMIKTWQKFGRINPHVLPLLAKKVFLDALQDLDVKLCVVDGEADPEIVAVANHYKCPVLAEDSDFYMFSIVGGYIPFSRFTLPTATAHQPEADVFHTAAFAEQYGLPSEDLRFLIPAILGNDFMKPVKHLKLGSSNAIVRHACQFLSLENFTTSLCKPDSKPVRNNCLRAVEFYKSLSKSLDELDTATKLQFPGGWILPKYRKGYFESFTVSALVLECVIFPVIVDDIDHCSSQLTGRRIRQSMYGILGCKKVTETLRSGIKLVDIEVDPLVDPSCPNIAAIGHDDSSCKRMQDVFCSILDCNREEINQLPQEWQLVVAASSYWFRNAEPDVYSRIAKALVFTFLACFQEELRSPSRLQRVATSPRKNYSPNALHAFAQWQSVYFDVVSLNQVLREPFQYTTPAFFYDGEIAMHYACADDSTKKDVLKDLGCSHKWEFYQTLMKLITGGRKDKNGVAAETKVALKEPKPRKEQSQFAHENRFALLADLPTD